MFLLVAKGRHAWNRLDTSSQFPEIVVFLQVLFLRQRSFIPLFIYLLFRNFTEGLRQRHLHLFACMGRYTLETYILQFHIWMKTTGLNGSPKRLLVVIPGYYWLNFAVLTVAYVFVSVRFSNLTGVLRDALIPDNLLSMCKIWTILIALGGTCWLSSLLWMGSLADVGWP